MGKGVINRLLDGLNEISASLPDKREASNGLKYGIADFALSAFAVFYFQHPSLLNFQEAMQTKRGRNNLETLFGVEKVPKADHVRNILDEISPCELNGVYDHALETAKGSGILESYRVLNGTIPLALDGVRYFSSERIHCEHCLRTEKRNRDGEKTVTYYHTVLAACIVKPGGHVVLPVIPEFIRNDDGQEKQDCERNAAKRWITAHKERYAPLKVTLLGDDLYACHSICSSVVESGMDFLFTCKDDSHPWIAEQYAYGEPQTLTRREWNGREHFEYRYRWMNGLENRAEGERLSVNYLYLEVYNEKKGKVTYHNSWITSHRLEEDNVQKASECGRARWKIENEHNSDITLAMERSMPMKYFVFLICWRFYITGYRIAPMKITAKRARHSAGVMTFSGH
jgi:hypothetical protein